MENEYLCFINLIGEDVEGFYTYELLFTDNPDDFWAEDFDVKPLGLCNSVVIEENTYNLKETIKTKIKLDLIQDNCCFSFQDAIDGIVSIGWQCIDELEYYPDYRLIFDYADTYDTVVDKLTNVGIGFEPKTEE